MSDTLTAPAREGLKSVMEIPWNVISVPASAKPKAQEEVVFAK